MYATKLMMQQSKIYDYVEDDSLLRKVENDVFGSKVIIPNVRQAVNSFTYCGTLPTAADGVLSLKTTMLSTVPSLVTLYLASNAQLGIRNYVNGTLLKPTLPSDYSFPVITDADIQPYVAFTLAFPTTTTQHMTFQYENGEKATFEGAWGYTTYNDVEAVVGSGTKLIDLALVYNRVLTDKEIEQNFRAFKQRYR
ncbi:MAG: hypothetical protein E7398_00300 [Ruminococcaceae bacterium]|nr:hypothetical protein [Oscillospiraceae bacterium]